MPAHASARLSRRATRGRLRVVLACAALTTCTALTTFTAPASPIVPTRDDEVIDVLPAVSGSRADARRLRRQLQAAPRDAAVALAAARRLLAQARDMGDPRFAGQALSAIAAWTDEADMPDEVLLMRATLQQYLHAFDASARSLQGLLARPATPLHAQARLTLATVRRVQGRYGESDEACRQLLGGAARLYGQACLAENLGLRGDFDRARTQLKALLAAPLPAATRGWLTTTLAELEQRAGRNEAADAAFRAALALDAEPYATLAYADFLIDRQRPAQALALLGAQVRSDAVVLRLAIAGSQAHAPSAAADVADMRERIALANERPDARITHGREQAMFALFVDHQARAALELARGNVAQQREPLDLLVLARAARAAADPAALRDSRRLVEEVGLHDTRTDAALL